MSYSFTPKRTKELFNNISFILLIFIGALALFVTAINTENKLIHTAALEFELEVHKQALAFFQEQTQTPENIEAFYRTLSGGEMVALYSPIGEKILEKGSSGEGMHAAPPSFAVRYTEPAVYQNEKLNAVLTLGNGERMVFSKPLPPEVVSKIWRNQLISIPIILAVIFVIYLTYRMILIHMIMRDTAHFLEGMFSIPNIKP